VTLQWIILFCITLPSRFDLVLGTWELDLPYHRIMVCTSPSWIRGRGGQWL